MSKTLVIAIFDVGKTNKKLFLFDENYRIRYERSARFIETTDEDGDPCENLESLRLSVFDSLQEVLKLKEFYIKAVNFSTYGASLVYIDEKGQPLPPMYNYLKDYPDELQEKFYRTYGGKTKLARETASPVLGSLNSGMQLYRIKYQKPGLFARIKYSLHLPQYLSYLITGKPCTDITSIGCHTGLWDFTKNDYHEWVYKEGLTEKFAPIVPSAQVMTNAIANNNYITGVGLHDSSAALIPYLANFHEPFVLISTGTWCISLNPFNHSPLTDAELANDCLCYMGYKGTPVKASRLFAGNEHELQVKRIASYFNVNTSIFKTIEYDAAIVSKIRLNKNRQDTLVSRHSSAFSVKEISQFDNYVQAYHQLMLDIMDQQYQSTNMVLETAKVNRIFVDGGFSKNSVYMNLLANAFPNVEVFAASMAQATAVGTAIAIHKAWNNRVLPADIIELKYYSAPYISTI